MGRRLFGRRLWAGDEDGGQESPLLTSDGLTLEKWRDYARGMASDPTSALQRAPLREGELVLLIGPKNKRHMLQLRPGGLFHHRHTGHVYHDEIVGKPPGCRFLSRQGIPVVCLRPTLERYVLKGLRRRTQVIYPRDSTQILIRGDIYPGARVLEAGLGSGSVALVLLRFLGPEGHLISYERREEFASMAQNSLSEFAGLYGTSGARHTIVLEDVYEGIREQDLDTILLDVPEPERAVESAAAALRPGGSLLCWLPTALQVYRLVRILQRGPEWAHIETTESLVRPWHVSEESIRPVHRMVAHTGFLISARRIYEEPADQNSTVGADSAPSEASK